MTLRRLRALAGLLVLGGACLLCLKLLPVYWSAWRFQQYLRELAADADAQRPEEWLRARLVSRAADLGLPVRGDQVRLARQGDRLLIEVRYVAPVRLALYTVDLHFRPRAGSP